jgi:hypothetical protein
MTNERKQLSGASHILAKQASRAGETYMGDMQGRGLEMVSRRGFIRIAAGSALVGSTLALVNACTSLAPTAPAAATPRAGTAPAGAAAGSSPYPNYYPSTTAPKPDFAAIGPEYQNGYINYPKNPAKSWTKAPPGLGSKMVSYTNAGAPLPPTAMDQNPAWQEVNKQLNATVEFQIITQTDYAAKLSTMMAGNDLTDFILITTMAQNVTAFAKARAADLTPYLAGDAVKEYPNLAALTTYSWKNSACARDGARLALPAGQHAAEEQRGLRRGDWQGLRAEGRRRLQARPAGSHQPAATPRRNGPDQQSPGHDRLRLGDFRRAQDLAAGL